MADAKDQLDSGAPTLETVATGLSRERRVQRVVEDCLCRRAAGESVSDEQSCIANSDLMPELGEALRGLAVIERARHARDDGARRWSGLWSNVTPHSFPGYELLREIHRGGQGVVYEALQESTGRNIAVKLMREGALATSSERARFDREVRILAQLKHPNIVAIHDSGVVDGRAYFVMDYIPGSPLDQYVADQFKTPDTNAKIDAVLRLFETISDAVNVAHLRGIIHRDLKPGNVRVDPNGQPHILDFGLAKLTEIDDAGDSQTASMTQTGQFVGSLPWSAPEQASGAAHDVDIRGDVYSLGVMLFQMLTGRLPYDLGGSIQAALERVANAQPIRPRTLNPAIDDELETVILTCLAKDRARRYQSAGELAREIARYRAGEPIEAKRDSVGYVLRKQLRKHRLPVAIAAGVLALIVVGFVVALGFWRSDEAERVIAVDERRQARAAEAQQVRERERADQERARATIVAQRATQVQQFLQKMLASVDPDSGRDSDLTVRHVLDEAGAELETSLADQPDVRAVLHQTLGQSYSSLRLFEPAQRHLESAVELRRRHLADEPVGLADALWRLAGVPRFDLTERDAALAQCREAVALFEAHALEDDWRLMLARALETHLAGVAGVPAAPEPDPWAALRLPLLLRLNDDQLALLPAELTDIVANARRLHEAGDSAGAVAALSGWRKAMIAKIRAMCAADERKAAFAYIRQLYSPMLEIPILRQLMTQGLIRSALDFKQEGEAAVCDVLLEEAVRVGREIRGADHPDVALALMELATLRRDAGSIPEAADLCREALRIHEKLGEEHPLTKGSRELLADILTRQSKLNDAAGKRD